MAKHTRVKITGISITLAISLLVTFIACDFQPKVIFDSAKSGDITLPFLTKAEIRQMLDETDGKNLPEEVMEVYPDYNPTDSTKPWNPGKVKQEALDLALNRLNALRRLCGLHPVIMTDETNKSAQYGAALLAITQKFGHGGQPIPEGVDEASYQKGINATTYGNLFQLGPSKLIAAVDGYCLDAGNLGTNLGHRMLCLAPNQQQIGFGTAPAPVSGGKGMNVEQIYGLPALPKDHVRKEFDWDFVSYPSAGYFPLLGSLFGSPAYWSIQLNGNKYTVDKDSCKVILTKLNDGSKREFSVSGNTIIFDTGNGSVKAGEIYKIEITGLKDKAGNPVDFAYKTEFFIP